MPGGVLGENGHRQSAALGVGLRNTPLKSLFIHKLYNIVLTNLDPNNNKGPNSFDEIYV